MVLSSRFTAPIPNCSIQEWIFGLSSGPLPNRKAWIDADHPDTHYLTFANARLLSKRIAVGLVEHGLKPGDRVLLYAANSFLYPVIVMGIWMAGGVFTGANPGYVCRELAFQLKDSEASMMIAAGETLHVALEAARLVGLAGDKIFMFDSALPDSRLALRHARGIVRHWSELIASRERGIAFEWLEPADARTATCALNYSSGTTGLPKGVEITHYNHVAHSVGVITFNKLEAEYEARARRAAALCFIPMYHAFCQGYFIASLPRERVSVYVMSKFDFPKMLSHIETFRITKLLAVPPILVLMSKHPLTRRADLSSIDMIGSGAAPLPANTQLEINRLMPDDGPALRQGWGMTEVTCTALSWDPTRPFNSGVGELMPDCMARLVNTETGEDITEGNTPGELWIAAPSVMRGYWRNPEATADTVTVDEGGTRWLRTGDIAYVEEYTTGTVFHIIDRFKELIKVKGYQVAPAELEALLLERADVADAAVVGIVAGVEERPRAYIVKVPGATASEMEISAWITQRVVHYKRLEGGVVFVDAIPKTPSGKILRKLLRESARKETQPRARL